MQKKFTSRWWQVGTALPLLMAILFFCDIAGRFLPLELVAFRTFEPALRTTPGGLGEFQPYKVVRMHRAYGDLAAIANMWPRQFHEEEFHSDELGFRNSGDIRNTPYAGVVTGDSFVISSAVPEADTLSARLHALSGKNFYDAGLSRLLFPGELTYLATVIKLQPKLVVCQILERALRVGAFPQLEIDPKLFTSAKAAEQAKGATSFLPWLTDVQQKLSPSAPSPLQIISQKIVKRLQNGDLQPNPYRNAIVHKVLKNGDEMLFLPEDLAPLGDVNALASSWGSFFQWYNGKLKEQDFQLVVLLVPNKYTVYGPLTKDDPSQPVGDALISNIAERLRAQGIPVVNVTDRFHKVAAERLPQRQYLYWLDDTHWNAAGIALAADAVWENLRQRSDLTGSAETSSRAAQTQP